MHEIKYIGFYSFDENRIASLAAINKMNYIINSLNKNKINVKIISPAWTNKNNNIKKEVIIKDKNSYIFPMSFKWKGILKILNIVYSNIWLFFYLLKNCHKDETVIIYHSLYLINVLSIIKKIKRIKIVLEIEEIYTDVSKKKLRNKEFKMFSLADKYIFITKMLNDKINVDGKKYCVSHGTYTVKEQNVNKYDDGKIHIVYSGIIDSNKKGAFTALSMCKYLDDSYILHIIGFGKDYDVNLLKEKIKVNNDTNKCKIIYDGKLIGNEYIKYLQKCDIGLSTQDPKGEYNDTSFPSKILAYLSNGLRVVSVNIPAIKSSDVGDILYYYDGDSPEEIANTIMNIDMNEKYDSRKLIKELDNEFTNNLKKMLGSDNND